MAKPLIGLTCGAHQRDSGDLAYGVLVNYTKSVADAGGLPVLIPPMLDLDSLREIYERLDGVLLTGGGDVDASQYGMANDGLVHGIQVDRDATEINVAKWAAQEDKPLLGICRGSQVINVALGGTLYRDIATEYGNHSDIEHDLYGKAPRGFEAHPVHIDSGTHLQKLLGVEQVNVNTLHHQALREVAPALKVVAKSADGLIEGVEMPDARFYVAVQWHPEEMIGYSEPMRRLFAGFVDSARR
jgi:putative glutamine amidotransferase